MLDLLSGFVAELRAAGLPVSIRESIDAAEALRAVDLARRPDVRAALRATLVKDAAHQAVFASVFDVYFSIAGAAAPGGPLDEIEAAGGIEFGAGEAPGGAPVHLSEELIAELLAAALESGDPAQLAELARLAVQAFAHVEPGRPVGISYYLYRTLRALDLEGALERRGPRGAGQVALSPGAPGDVLDRLASLGPLGARLVAEEYLERARLLRELIEAEIRRLLIAERGSASVAASMRRPLVEDVDFMHATSSELVAMRRAVYPLTRALAARLARRRRHRRRGPLDMRSTIRHSLSSGGVPFEIRYRQAHPSKPEILVVADVSGSVASFARFTLHLVYAIASQFSRVRSFVFVDGIDEVTEIFERSATIAEAIARVGAEADVIEGEGHSNYGRALARLVERHGREIGPRTNVIVLGDARNNYHASGAEHLAELARRARRLYWLNPEPRAYWGSGDSIIDEYAEFADGVFECRNLRQLERFVTTLG